MLSFNNIILGKKMKFKEKKESVKDYRLNIRKKNSIWNNWKKWKNLSFLILSYQQPSIPIKLIVISIFHRLFKQNQCQNNKQCILSLHPNKKIKKNNLKNCMKAIFHNYSSSKDSLQLYHRPRLLLFWTSPNRSSHQSLHHLCNKNNNSPTLTI